MNVRYQSPCGDSFHFNARRISVVHPAAAYQSPCGDSFHFNNAKHRTTRRRSIARINPLAGILFISTPRRIAGGVRAVAGVSIPLRGFFSFQRVFVHDEGVWAGVLWASRINPLAGILFISTHSRARQRRGKERVSIPLRGFFSFQPK